MPLYKIKLIQREEIVLQTLKLTFEKPAHFSFKPGQYGGFTLIDPSEVDTRGMTRRFSLLSTPEDPHLAIMTRIQTSAFKRELSKLPLGAEIKFAGPIGHFLLHEDVTIPAVMLAGGIGITPFFSMIRYNAYHRIPQSLTLFYGNQSLANTVFFNELIQVEKDHPYFKLIATFDRPHKSWQGEKGFITPLMIKKYINDIFLPIYYICGAPVMVSTMQETLIEMGIDENKIFVEDFPGY